MLTPGDAAPLTLQEVLERVSDRSLLTLHRCAKVKARHWFADPRAMVVLREVCKRRGLIR
jgi:hypothetical protein